MAVPSFQSTLACALSSITAPSFCCSGALPPETPDPRLHIKGMPNPLILPIDDFKSAEDRRTLMKLSRKAPCGIGTETVIDENVRRCRQIDSPQISLSEAWNSAVQALAGRVAAQLGVFNVAVSAQLHKLVLYEPGDMFRAHVDGEKEPGMFATLVVQLPSSYSGAILVVSHDGVERHIDLSSRPDDVDESATNFFPYAAFFTDCVHEVTELMSGLRVTLLYNLVRDQHVSKLKQTVGATTYTPETDSEVVRQLEECARQWTHSARCQPVPLRLMLPLQHRYTMRDVSFDNLKGRDAAMVLHLCQSGAFEMRIILVEKAVENFGKDGVDSCSEDDEDHAKRVRGLSPAAKRRRMLVAKHVASEEPFEKYFRAIKTVSERGEEPIGAPWMYELDWKLEVLDGELFRYTELPVDGDYQVTGNEGIRIDLKYQRTVLALWPKANASILAIMPEFKQHLCKHFEHIVTSGATDEHEAQWFVLRSLSCFYPRLAVESLPMLLDVACRRGEKEVVKRLVWQAGGNYSLSSDHSPSANREVFGMNYDVLGVCTEKHVAAFMRGIELCGADELSRALKACFFRSPKREYCVRLTEALLDRGDDSSVKLGVELAKDLVKNIPWESHLAAPFSAIIVRDECSEIYAAYLKEISPSYNEDFCQRSAISTLKEIERPDRAKARAFFFQPVWQICVENVHSMREEGVAFMYRIGVAHEERAKLDDLSKQVRMTKSCIFVHKLLQHAEMLALAKSDTVHSLAHWHARRLRKVQGTNLAGQPDTEIEGHAALSEFLRGMEEEFISEPLANSEEADRLSRRLRGFSVWAVTTGYSEEGGVRLKVRREDEEKWNATLAVADVNKKMAWLHSMYGVGDDSSSGC